MLIRILIAAAMIFVSPVLGQEKPKDSDSPAYKQAYELIFDSRARANKAEQLILENGKRKLAELTAKELSLLCRVYNELGNSEIW